MVTQSERIASGGLATSTEQRLRELTRWGGFTSFLSPSALVVGQSVGVDPVAQVVGLSAGRIVPGYLRIADRWKRPVASGSSAGASWSGSDTARWQEHPQIVRCWDVVRQRALSRLRQQAERLGCQAVVGVVPRREFEPNGEEGHGILEFTGTAVRIDDWTKRKTGPVLTLASMSEVALMLGSGIEPVGIAGGVGRVELRPAQSTMRATRRSGARVPSFELDDLTHSIYEVRRGAMRGLGSEAAKLGATGVLDVRLEVERRGSPTAQLPGVDFTAFAISSAIRRTRAPTGQSVRAVVHVEGRSGG